MLGDSQRFWGILSHSDSFKDALGFSYGCFKDSWQFQGILWDSLGLFKILRDAMGFF